MLRTFLISLVLVLSGSASMAANADDHVPARVAAHHGLEAWWGTEVLAAEVTVAFGGNTVCEGTMYVETNGPRARLDLASGPVAVYDGETCWIRPADAEVRRARFHVLTWAWFAIAPFKVEGDGIHLTDWEEATSGGETYLVSRQTFDAGEGDTPDDWYDLWIDPATGSLQAMGYIVTYGKDLETANAEPHAIGYHDEITVDGVTLPSRWTFHMYARDTGIGETIGTGSVSNVRFVPAGDLFAVDRDAMAEVPMP